MMKNIVKFFLVTLVFLLLPSFITKPILAAATDCTILKGSTGPNAGWIMNGKPCDNKGQFNQVTSCIGTGGYQYLVTYCVAMGDNGCQAEYPVQGDPGDPYVPALCNRPQQAQTDIGKIFGIIKAPLAIEAFGFGAKGISTFLSNAVTLIYSFATIVLIFMLLWGAFEWITSGGDKEKLASAQKRITNAIIGILLFGVAFAIIQVLGTFTGFTFFVGQK